MCFSLLSRILDPVQDGQSYLNLRNGYRIVKDYGTNHKNHKMEKDWNQDDENEFFVFQWVHLLLD